MAFFQILLVYVPIFFCFVFLMCRKGWNPHKLGLNRKNSQRNLIHLYFVCYLIWLINIFTISLLPPTPKKKLLEKLKNQIKRMKICIRKATGISSNLSLSGQQFLLRELIFYFIIESTVHFDTLADIILSCFSYYFPSSWRGRNFKKNY